jgi:hypothetical protein
MSADRSRTYEISAFTPLELLKARGASEKEIADYIKRREAMFLRRDKKQ